MLAPQRMGMAAGIAPAEPEAVAGETTPPSDNRQALNQTPEPAEEGDNEEPNVSPEEQAEYDEFVEAGLAAISEGGKVKDGIIELLDNDPSDLIAALGDEIPELEDRFSPIIAVAATAVVVVREAEQRIGRKPSDEVLLQGGRAILEAVVELKDNLGDDMTQEEINRAFLHAVDIYRAVADAAGEVDNEAASAAFAEVANAEEQGKLGEVLPALEGAQSNGVR